MRKYTVYPLIFMIIFLICLFAFFTAGCKDKSTPGYEPVFGPPPAPSLLVVSRYAEPQEVGYRILNSGGNAIDAFVAVTLAENVVAPGTVTLAGLLETLIYLADTNVVRFMDAGFNSVLDPNGAYSQKVPVLGKTVAVPGLISGLEAILTRYGRMSFAEVLQPAIELARDGFEISEKYSLYIEYYAQKLQRTEYGRRTFFPDGTALQPGETLRQPELAEFLSNLAEQGSAYMYSGEWAEQCVETVQREGGLMTTEDLASYQPTFGEPWKMSYRGHDICASSGRVMFGLWTLLALKTLEHTTVQPLGHFSESADALEIMVRIARAVEEEEWIRDYWFIDDRELVNSRLALTYTNDIWAKVEGALDYGFVSRSQTEETLCSVILDDDGNVVSGKHSINSDIWGEGLFVQGIPLSATGEFTGRYTGPGKRRTQGASNFLVFKDGSLRYACGSIGSSNPYVTFQFLVNAIDYGLPADQAADLPQFGSYTYEDDLQTNWLDERVSQEVVNILEGRGLYFNQVYPRLGAGCIVKFHLNGDITSGWNR